MSSKELEEALKAFEELRPIETQLEPNKILSEDPFEVARLFATAKKLLSLGYGRLKDGSDKELVRHFFGGKTAAYLVEDWQKYPTFQFFNGENTMDLWDCEINLPAGMTRAEYGAQTIAAAFENLPFNRFNFCIYDVLSGFMIYALIIADADGECVSFASWTKGKNTPWFARGVCSKRGENGMYYHAPVSMNGQNLGFDNISKFIADSISCCCAYMQQTSKHAIEVSVKEPKVMAGSKTGKKKPWLRDDKKYIIYVDPYKAREHGHNSDSMGSGPKRRAHARRGHWRRYKVSEKRERELLVFVRPAWIGPGEWEHQGKVYKLIKDKKVEEAE